MGKTIRISFENICSLQAVIKINKRGCRYGELFVTSGHVKKRFKGNLIDEQGNVPGKERGRQVLWKCRTTLNENKTRVN